MGVITNIISTIFTSTGAGDVTGDTERLGRAQTRLGQSSAGTGRQFSAQASGLGGLVAAYAGAAATSFALQAAFTGLANSARSLQTLEGLTALAAASGIAGKDLLATTQKITKGQLSLVESAQQVNLAVSAGFNTDQIEGLSEVALKASRALGRDLGDAYTRVVRGSAKMETELLDELGIYTKIEPATRAYALSIGKTVGQLSEYERRQAFVNAVVAEGQRKFSSINTTIPTAAEKIEAFGKRIVDLGIQLGAFLAERLAPLADFFTNNLAAAIGAFGILGSLVLGKTFSVLKEKIQGFQNWVEGSATAINQRILNLTKASAQRTQAAQASVAGISLVNKGTTGIGSELKDLKDIAAQRALTTQELTKAQSVLQKRITNLNTLRAAEVRQIVTARAARAATVAGTAAHVAAQLQLTNLSKKLKATNSLLSATTTQLNAVTAATTSSNAAFARFASAVVRRVGTAAAAIARLGMAIVGIGGFILSAVSIIGVFGTSIAKALGKGDEFNGWVQGIGKTIKAVFSPEIVKNTKAVFQGITAGSLTSLEKTNQKLRELDSFKFKQKKYLGITIEIEKTKEDLVKEVSSLLSNISLDKGLGVADIVSTGSFWGTTLAGAFAGALLGGFSGLPGAIAGALYGGLSAAIGNIMLNIGDDAVQASSASMRKIQSVYSRELANLSATAGPKAAETAAKALAVLEDQYGAAARLDPAAKEYLETAKKLVLEGVKQVDNVTQIAEIIAATGKSADQVVKNYNFDDSLTNLYSAVESKSLGIKIKIINTDIIESFLTSTLQYNIPIDPDLLSSPANRQALYKIQDQLRMGISMSDILVDFNIQGADPKILDFIADLNYEGLEAQNTFARFGNVTKTINIGQIFAEAIAEGKEINSLLFMTVDLLASTEEGINTGTLSFEQYSQAIGNISSAIETTKRSIPGLNSAIQETINAIVLGQRYNLDTSMAEDMLVLLQDQRDAALTAIQAEERKLTILKAQEGILKNQIAITSFIANNTPKDTNMFDLELAIFKSAASNKGEELAITIDYMSQIVTKTNAARAAYDAYAAGVTSSGLSGNIQAVLLSATSESLYDTVDTLNEIEGVQAEVVGNNIQIQDSSIAGVQSATGSIKTITGTVSKAIQTEALLGNDAINSITANATEALSLAISSMKDYMAEYNTLIADIDNQLIELSGKERIATIQFAADLSQVYRDIDIIKQEAAIEQLNLNIDLVKAKEGAGAITGIEAAKQENAIRQQILQEQETLILLQAANEFAALEDRRTLLGEEHKQNLTRLEQEAQLVRDKIAADLSYITALIGVYEENISKTQVANQSLITGFTTAGNNFNTDLAGVFTQASSAIGTAIASMGTSTPGVLAITSSAPSLAIIETNFATLQDSFVASAGEALTANETRLNALTEAENTRYSRAEEMITAEQERIIANYNARLEALAKEGDIEGYNAVAREKKAAEAGGADAKLSEIDKKLMQLFDSIKGHIETALMGLNNLLFYGEGNFGDIMGNLFKSIQQDFFKQTIAQPLSDALTTGLFGLFGVDVGAVNTKGERGLTYEGNNLLVKVVNASEFGLGGALGGATDPNNPEATGVVGWMSKLFGKDGTVSGFFSNLFGEGGILSNLLGGFGSFLGSIFKAIFGGIFGGGLATGGIAHMAQGGVAGASALRRDRIPTLLEPGEFVVRKPAAKMIGTPALNSLNATGQMPNTNAAPIINIKNEGTAKDVQTSQPRFDGDKFVIDIILRDLSNNGPIRRSLRGGNI